jgi:uncharacterized protein (DUF305 family)
MEPIKVFNNVIIGQFVLTGIPVKVYISGRYLTITNADDIEDPIFGFGMDEDGDMMRFDYRAVDHLLVAGNKVDLETYNTGMGAKEDESKEEPKEEPKKEESFMKLGNILKEISQEEVDAEVEGAEAAIDAAKAKLKAAQAAMKTTVKKSKEKIKAAQSQPIDESHQGYTFGVGDIVKNKNTSCPHHGSMGVVNKLMDIPMKGVVAVYTVTNNGPTYSPGDKLTKTIDQLAPIQAPDDLEGDM